MLFRSAYHPDYFEHLKRLSAGKSVEFVTDADDDRVLELYRRAWVNVLPSVFVDCYGTSHEAPELMGFTTIAITIEKPGFAPVTKQVYSKVANDHVVVRLVKSGKR